MFSRFLLSFWWWFWKYASLAERSLLMSSSSSGGSPLEGEGEDEGMGVVLGRVLVFSFLVGSWLNRFSLEEEGIGGGDEVD